MRNRAGHWVTEMWAGVAFLDNDWIWRRWQFSLLGYHQTCHQFWTTRLSLKFLRDSMTGSNPLEELNYSYVDGKALPSHNLTFFFECLIDKFQQERRRIEKQSRVRLVRLHEKKRASTDERSNKNFTRDCDVNKTSKTRISFSFLLSLVLF